MATKLWTGTDNDNNLNNDNNWNPAGTPGGADTATFDIGAGPLKGTLSVSQFLATDDKGTGIVVAMGGGAGITATSETIGDVGQVQFDLGNATNTISTSLVVGNLNSATADYHMNGGTVSVGTNEIIGMFGAGKFEEQAGTHTITGSLTLGQTGSASGEYDMADGTLTVNANEMVGLGGAGKVGQGGGTHNVDGILTIGAQAGPGGQFNLAGGDLFVGTLATQVNEVIGGAAQGQLDQTDTFSQTNNDVIGGVIVGSNAGIQGLYTLNGDNTTTVDCKFSANALTLGLAGNGTLDVNGSSTATISGVTNLGVQAGSGGTLEVIGANAVFNASGVGAASVITAGVSGSGLLDIESGALVSANNVNFALNATGSAQGSISGSGELDVAGNLIVAQAGAATVSVGSEGTISADRILLGNLAGSHGAMQITDANTLVEGSDTSTSSSAIVIGVSGTGGVDVDNGAMLTSATSITLGANSGSTGGLIVTGGAKVDAVTTLMVGVSGTGGLAGGTDGLVSVPSIVVGKLGGIEAGSLNLPSPFTGTFSGIFTLDASSLTNNGKVVVDDGSALDFGIANDVSTFTNNTLVTINSTGDFSELDITGAVTLLGAGKVTLSDNANNNIVSDGNPATLTNGNATAGNTISGAGTIGDANLTLSNQAKGIINGNGVNNALTLDTGANAITNLGILEGATAQGLIVASNVSNSNLIEALGTNARVDLMGTITNSTATASILASGTNAHVDLDGADIIGGTLKFSGTGTAFDVIGDSIFDGSGVGKPVNNTAVVNVQNGNALTLKGTFNNTGTVALNSTGAETDLVISGAVALLGAGKVTLSDNANNAIVSDGSAATLTNGNATAGNTISGAGTIGDANLTLSNQAKGIINGNGVNNALTLDTGANAITNLGILEGATAQGLIVASNVSNSNLIEALGTNARVDLMGTITNSTATASILASGTNAHVDLDGADIIGGTLKFSGTGTAFDVIGDSIFDGSGVGKPVNNTAVVNVQNGNALTLKGTFNNTGTVALNSTGAETDLVISGAVTLLGAGKVTLSDNANNAIVSDGSAATLTNGNATAGNTISGAGTIGDANLTLSNQAKGIINGNGVNNALTLDTGANAITNLGILEGATAQGLIVASNVSNSNLIEALGTNARVDLMGTITNSTATASILASGTNAHVDLDGADIIGGTLKFSGTGTAFDVIGDSIFDGSGVGKPVNNTAVVNVQNGNALTLKGTFNNTGTVALNSTGAETDLVISGAVALLGAGKVTLSDNANNAIVSDGSAATLTNGNATAGNTISGAGTIGDANLTLSNQAKGIINGNGVNNALTLDTGAHAITNLGILEGATAQGLIIKSNVTNSNLIEALGTNARVDLLGSTVTNSTATASILASGTNAHVDLDGVTVTGGKFATVGTGAITVSGNAAITDVSNTGSMTAGGTVDTTLTVDSATNVFNNSGKITFDGSTHIAQLRFASNMTLQGGGAINLTGDNGDNTIITGSSTILNNGTATLAHTIMGGGDIGDGTGDLTLINGAKGVINGNDPHGAIALQTGNLVTNNGIMEGTVGGGGVSIFDSVANNNLIEALGTNAHVELDGAITVTNGPAGVLLASGTNASVVINGATVTGGTLKTASGGSILALNGTLNNVSNTGNLTVEELGLQGSTFNNTSTGVVTVSFGTLAINNSLTMQGGGSIALGSNGHIVASAPATLTFGGAATGQTINGSGAIGDNSNNLTLVNSAKGIINGNGTSDALTIHTGTNAISNLGILEGTTAQGLTIKSNVTNSNLIQALGTNARVDLLGTTITDNTAAATILASGTGAHVDLDGATIAGGTLKFSGTGTAINVIGASTFDGSGIGAPVNNTAIVNVQNGETLTLKGAFNNTGTVGLNSSGAETDLVIAGSVALTGAGKIVLAGADAQILSDGNATTLTNGNTTAGNTISGVGTLGDHDFLSVANAAKGIVNASDAAGGTLAIDTKSFTNAGLLEATGHGVLELKTDITDTATGQVKAAAAGAHVSLDGATVSGGTVSTIIGSFLDSVGGSSTISTTTAIANAGRLGAEGGDLTITGPVNNTGTLDANNAHLTLQGAVTGTGKATIEGTGSIEFGAASATTGVTFANGATGELILDHSMTYKGTITGFTGPHNAFSSFLGFGDSTLDSGFFPTALANNLTADETGSGPKNALIAAAVAAGGTGTPVGVGLMHSQILANDFGVSALPSDTPGGAGTNFAIAGATDAPNLGSGSDPGNGGVGNLNKNSSLASTVTQINGYLAAHSNTADANALYVISSGGNDITYAKDSIVGTTAQHAYLTDQATALATAIKALETAGAQHVLLDNNYGSGGLSNFYNSAVATALASAGATVITANIQGVVATIVANPTLFGFTANTVQVGDATLTAATQHSAFQPQLTPAFTPSGWAQWGANTTTPSANFASLRAPNAQFTSLFSDNQHLSTIGQIIEANYEFSLLATAGLLPSLESIDLKDIAYNSPTSGVAPTIAKFSGTGTGGTLTVTDDLGHTAALTLSGDYRSVSFITADDGSGGTLVFDPPASSSTTAAIADNPLSSGHYAAAITTGTNLGMTDFTISKNVTLTGDGIITLAGNETIISDGHNHTLTIGKETISGGGIIGDDALQLINSAHGVIDANSTNDGMLISTPGHTVSNAGTIEASDGGWLMVDHTTIANNKSGVVQALDAGTRFDLDGGTISGGQVNVGAGATLETVNDDASTINAKLNNSGTVAATAGDLTINGSVTNSGVLSVANGNHLVINGAISGSGAATIASGGTLQIDAASNANVTFLDGTGTLVLDHPANDTFKFASTVTGFQHGAGIELVAIDYTTGLAQLTFVENAAHTSGVLTVTDGLHSDALAFVGNYTANDFVVEQNNISHHVDILHV